MKGVTRLKEESSKELLARGIPEAAAQAVAKADWMLENLHGAME